MSEQSKSSYGQSLLRHYLTLMIGGEILENYRPAWLGGMEIDLFFPALAVGVEFQGDQHYVPTKFGLPNDQKERDKMKRNICKSVAISLCRIDAVDLEWTRIRGKLDCIRGRFWKPITPVMKRELAALNAASKAYRCTLKKSFAAVSVYRIGSARRRNAVTAKWASAIS